jgi:hypothetical protein
MSQIFVCELPGLAQTDQADSVSIVPAPSTAEYNVIVSAGSSGAAAPFLPGTKFIEVSCDTTCSINVAVFGTGTAALTNRRLNANERITLRVPTFPIRTNPGSPSDTGARYAIYTTANV